MSHESARTVSTLAALRGAGAAVGPPQAERFVFSEEATRAVTRDMASRAPLASLRLLLRAWPMLYVPLVLIPVADLLGFVVEPWFLPDVSGGREIRTAINALFWFVFYAWQLNAIALTRCVTYFYFDGCELVHTERGRERRYVVEIARKALFGLEADESVKRIELNFGKRRWIVVAGLVRMDDFAAHLRTMLSEDAVQSKPVLRTDYRPLFGAFAIDAFAQHTLGTKYFLLLFLLQTAILCFYYREQLRLIRWYWRWSRR